MAKKLKKGSAEAKAWGRKMARSPKRKTLTKLKRNSTMVKRKTKRRTSRKSNKVLGLNVSKVSSAMLYGALRGRTSDFLSRYTAKIPLGNISDEIGMFLLASAGKKYIFKKSGILREALTIGQGIEMARVGEAIINGQVGIGGMSANSTSPYFS